MRSGPTSEADDGSGSDLDSSPDLIANAWFHSEALLARQSEAWQRTRLLEPALSSTEAGRAKGEGRARDSTQETDTADISEWSSLPALPATSPPKTALPPPTSSSSPHAEQEDEPDPEPIRDILAQQASSPRARDDLQDSQGISQGIQGFTPESQGIPDFVQETDPSAYSGIRSPPLSAGKSVTSSPAHRARLGELSRRAEFFQTRDAPLFCVPNTPSSDEIRSRTTTTTISVSRAQSSRNQSERERTKPRSMSVDAPLLDTPSKRSRSFGSELELGRTMNVNTSSVLLPETELHETLRSVTGTERTDSDSEEADADRTTSLIDPTSPQKLHPWNWSQVQDVTETSIRLTTGASRSSSLKRPAAPEASVTASEMANAKKLRFAPTSEPAKAGRAGLAGPRTLALGAASTSAKSKPAAAAAAAAAAARLPAKTSTRTLASEPSRAKRIELDAAPQPKGAAPPSVPAQVPSPAQTVPPAEEQAPEPDPDREEPVLPKTFRGFKSVGDHVGEIEKKTLERRKKRLARKPGSESVSISFGSSSSSSTGQRRGNTAAAAPHLFRGMHFLLLVAYDRSTFQWINRIYEYGGTVAPSSGSLFSHANDAKRVTHILTKYSYADCCKELRVASLEALPVRTVKFDWLSECVERKQVTLENGQPPTSFRVR